MSFLELTASNSSKTKIMINTDHIISIAPASFTGTTQIMLLQMMMEVEESYNEVKNMIFPH